MAKTNAIAIPESITIDGKEILIAESPELMAFANAVKITAAQTEKDKLYTTMATKDASIVELKNQKETLAQELQAVRPTTPSLSPATTAAQNSLQQVIDNHDPSLARDAQGNPIPSPNSPNSFATKEEMRAWMVETFNTNLPGIVQEAIRPYAEKVQELETERVENYRARVLAENEGKVIVELVKGTTIEEIAASVQQAKEAHTRYVAPQATQHTPNVIPTVEVTSTTETPIVPVNVVPTVPTNTIPPATPLPPANSTLLEGVHSMKGDEYAKNREALFRDLATQV